MPFGTSLSLSPDSPTKVSSNAVTFAQRFSDENRGVFAVAGLANPLQRMFTVGHKVDGNGTLRHLAKIDQTLVDALNMPAPFTLQLTAIRPPNTIVTDAALLANFYLLVDAMFGAGSGAGFIKWLNRET